jgi:hypothetical protein
MTDIDTAAGYDLIGDIHGMSDMLARLLAGMGYAEVDGVWRHPTRTAVFVGDFVDRGPGQIATYRMVRAMVEAGSALAAMGNHEFNAIAFHTPDGAGGHRRQRTDKNIHQHAAYIGEVGLDSPLHDEMVAWFLTLPLWLDLGDVRVVHACWDEDAIATLAPHVDAGNRLKPEALEAATSGTGNAWRADGTRKDGSAVFHAVETLLKGVEVELPDGLSYSDADGHVRTATRVAWWHGADATYRSAALAPRALREAMPDVPLPAPARVGYTGTAPLFIGHYWMTGAPAPLTPKVACVDYSVAKAGAMVAYRWSGETELTADNYHVVETA